MHAVQFDTLEFANRLKAVGFTQEQAETITDLQRAAADRMLDEVATKTDAAEIKRDIKQLESDLKHDLKQLDTDLRKEIEILRADTGRIIAESKADLTRWIIAAGFLQTTLIMGVLLKIAHLI